MKIRNGFVSNSSSASFIIHWRYKSFGVKYTLKTLLYDIFGIPLDKNGKFLYPTLKRTNSKGKIEEINIEDDEHYKIRIKMAEKVLRYTKDNGDKTYTTEFITSMMNDFMDFGEEAMFLFGTLATDRNFQIIDHKVERDEWGG